MTLFSNMRTQSTRDPCAPSAAGAAVRELKPVDVLLHPVRLRIAQAFLGDRSLTTGDLRAELSDVPSATLYRQVAALAEGGVLEVVDERRVRGSVERTYRLRSGAALVDADAARTMTHDEHRRAFMTFVLGLVADFDAYLDRGDVDLGRDLVGYRRNALYLTDAELTDVLDGLRGVLGPHLDHGPGDGRSRRLLATVLMPGVADR
jgi:DNA-binding transcriptional ArsR family regulator